MRGSLRLVMDSGRPIRAGASALATCRAYRQLVSGSAAYCGTNAGQLALQIMERTPAVRFVGIARAYRSYSTDSGTTMSDLLGPELPAKLKCSFEQVLIRRLVRVRGDHLVQPFSGVVHRMDPGQIVAHTGESVGEASPLCGHCLPEVKHCRDVGQRFAPYLHRAALDHRGIALQGHRLAREPGRQYLFEAAVNIGLALFDAMHDLMHCNGIEPYRQILFLHRLEEMTERRGRTGVEEQQTDPIAETETGGHQQIG